MIFKNSFLDAYGSFNGSSMTNAAIFVSLMALVTYPEDLSDESPYKDKLVELFWLSAVTHGLNLVWSIGNFFARFRHSYISQMIVIAQVMLYIWLASIAFEIHIQLQAMVNGLREDDRSHPLHPAGYFSSK